MFITAPDFKIRHVDWELERPAQANTGLGGKRRTAGVPWFGKWYAHVELIPLVGAERVREYRSFFARCNGPVNTFQLPAVEDAQNGNSGVTLDADAAKYANNITITGAATAMTLGQYVTLADQLLLVVGIAGDNLTVDPHLRGDVSAGAAVETSEPYALVSLVSSSVEWAVEPGTIYSISFDVEEAY